LKKKKEEQYSPFLVQGGKMIRKSRSLFLGIPLFTLVLAGGIMAADEIPDIREKMGVEGYAFWQLGQIVKGKDRVQGLIDHAWFNDVLIGLSFKARPSEHLTLVISPEFNLSYPYPPERNYIPSVRPFGSAYINEAYGKFLFGDLENPLLEARLGMFAFKYSKDVRNLGDYLFRTGTYPTYIINYFDFPAARLLGLCLSSNAVPNLHADLLLTSEFSMFPFGDFSLAGIASYNVFNVIEVGGGIDFARLIPINNDLTSPKYNVGESPYPNVYVSSKGDTGFYSFAATKVMARASIDPKPFFGWPEFFGKEDLKLYGEVCWVGIEGYDDVLTPDSVYLPWYQNLNERTPRMVGFNWPTHPLLSYFLAPGIAGYFVNKNKFNAQTITSAGVGVLAGTGLWLLEQNLQKKFRLDLLAIECEYFPTVLPNDYGSIMQHLSPMLHIYIVGLSGYKEEDWNKGAWRWSIYAKKMVISGFSVTAQAAFDHMRTMSRDVGAMNTYESLLMKGHWHWKLKFGYSF
jgi:hypothetical protein